MILLTLAASLLIAQDRPVIRLEESTIQGNVRKPALVELEGRRLQEAIEQAALKNLISLEKSLLKLRPPPAHLPNPDKN